MTNYTNIVNIMSHTRRTRLGTPQTSCIVNSCSLGNKFVPLQVSLNYFLHEIPGKRAHAITISLWNDKPIRNEPIRNTNFDQDKLFLEKSFITLLF